MSIISIENKSGKIRLKDVVAQPVMDELLDQIGRLFGAQAAITGAYTGELTNCIENAVDELEIEIHSPGGSVFDGFTLYNELLKLRGRGVKVTATINTLAASMASVIAMAADKIRIVPNGQIMIHEAQTGVRGTADDLRKAAEQAERMNVQLADIYAARTGLDVEEVRAMMKRETWMDAKDAVEKKFADEILRFDSLENSMSILAKLFPGNDQVAQLEAQVAENDTLRAELLDAKAKVDELSALAEVNSQLQNELAASATQVTELTAKATELEAKVAELEAVSAESQEAVSAKAAELLAAQGHAGSVALAADGNDVMPTLLDQFAALTGEEATKFFNENRAAILAEQGRYRV